MSGNPLPTPDSLHPEMNSFAVGAADGAAVGAVDGAGVGVAVLGSLCENLRLKRRDLFR